MGGPDDTASAEVAVAAAHVPFGHALQRVVERAWASLQDGSESAGLMPPACEDLRDALLHRLSAIASQPLGQLFSGRRTLADVAIARIADGMAAGATDANYRLFCQAQRDSGFSSLLAEFPVLGRLLATVVRHWTIGCQELFLRITKDRASIERAFGIPRQMPICSLATELSDPHRGGRAVVVVTFGDNSRLVYKPRSMDMEARFQDFLAMLSPLLPGDPLRRLAVLPLHGYGYVEHVAPRAADGPEKLRAFYRNSGRLLAVLYLLGATDCHWENMIAAGDQMLLIDAETLFEGVVAGPIDAEVAPNVTAFKSPAPQGIEGSVLGTGMLPSWISVGPVRSIDISALGAPAADELITQAAGWCFVNTDDMVWGSRQVEPSHPGCLPVQAENVNPLCEHAEGVLDGFKDVVDVLTQPDTRERARRHLQAFRGARRRVVVRPTRTYVLIQENALDPDALRDPDERALRLERLTRAYVGEGDKPRTWPLLRHEIAALESLDVPYFEGVVGSPDLFVGNDLVVEGYYEREGLQESLRRLETLSETSCRWQSRLIRGAIAARRFEMGAPVAARGRGRDIESDERFRHTAHDIADMIAAEALDDPAGEPTWLTVTLLADATRVQLGLVPPGLYDGRAGIAAFLYDCNEGELAARTLHPVLEKLDDRDEVRLFRYLRNIGLGMSGVGGLLRLFRYRSDSDESGSAWLERSDRVIAALSGDLLAASQSSDLVSGLAGLAPPVAAVHRNAPTRATTRVLSVIGRRLLKSQDSMGGWPLAPGHPALVGLSHGASGVAVALAEIAVALEDDQYAEAAARGLDFEARLFDPDALNWPDLRRSRLPVDRVAMRSWCHGSVGVALARLRMLELLGTHKDAERWRQELVVAIESSLSAPLTAVDHLCCGNMGRAAVIRLAGQSTGDARWESEGARIGSLVASGAGDSPENYRLLLGIDGTTGLRLPGFMTGLSGVGMYLLHGADLRWARCLLL
jgi:type 2 lantibiotic biosynthesis protein LanM